MSSRRRQRRSRERSNHVLPYTPVFAVDTPLIRGHNRKAKTWLFSQFLGACRLLRTKGRPPLAFVTPITLSIFANPNSSTNLFAEIRYTVHADGKDAPNNQSYREVCELIGDDTPGDGTDDLLRVLRDVTSQFGTTAVEIVRDTVHDLPKTLFNEDNNGLFSQADEIRARVTLTPISANVGSTTRESNQVVLNAIVIGGGPISG